MFMALYFLPIGFGVIAVIASPDDERARQWIVGLLIAVYVLGPQVAYCKGLLSWGLFAEWKKMAGSSPAMTHDAERLG